MFWILISRNLYQNLVTNHAKHMWLESNNRECHYIPSIVYCFQRQLQPFFLFSSHSSLQCDFAAHSPRDGDYFHDLWVKACLVTNYDLEYVGNDAMLSSGVYILRGITASTIQSVLRLTQKEIGLASQRMRGQWRKMKML